MNLTIFLLEVQSLPSKINVREKKVETRKVKSDSILVRGLVSQRSKITKISGLSMQALKKPKVIVAKSLLSKVIERLQTLQYFIA